MNLSSFLLLVFASSVFAQSTTFAIARIKGTVHDPTISGTVQFVNNDDKTVTMIVSIQGITNNLNNYHGIHIHMYGDLSTNDGNSVGSHLNPANASHGCPESGTRHLGDTGNWLAYRDGKNIVGNKTLDLLKMIGNNSIIGYGIILHNLTDDCINTTSSGVRLAQGVIGVANPSIQGAVQNDASPSAVPLAKVATNAQAVCVLQGATPQAGEDDNSSLFPNITLISDSWIGQGQPLPYEDNFAGRYFKDRPHLKDKVQNLAMSGQGWDWIMTKRQEYLAARPYIVHIGFGRNDFVGNGDGYVRPDDVYFANQMSTWRALIEMVKSDLPGVRISVQTLTERHAEGPGSVTYNARFNLYRPKANNLIRSWKDEGLIHSVVDFGAHPVLGASPGFLFNSSPITSDGLHPDGTTYDNKTGSGMCYEVFAPAMDALIAATPIPSGKIKEFVPVTGTVWFTQTSDGVAVSAVINGLSDSSHPRGFHIHQWGDISLNNGSSAGPHWTGSFYNSSAPHSVPGSGKIGHVGDMGNIFVRDSNGSAYYHNVFKSFGIFGDNIESIIGRSVVVHNLTDDCTGTNGNSGARIAHCVIGVANPDFAGSRSQLTGVSTAQNVTNCNKNPPATATTTATTTSKPGSDSLTTEGNTISGSSIIVINALVLFLTFCASL